MTEFEELVMQEEIADFQKYHIRWFIRRDMSEVVAIEAENNSFIDPDFDIVQLKKSAWSEEDFLRNLRQRNVIGMVIEHQEMVVGYIVYELHKHKIEILKLDANKKLDWNGILRVAIKKMISKLSRGLREKIEICVPEGSLPLQKLLKSEDFRAKKVLRGHFNEVNEDGYLLEKVLK